MSSARSLAEVGATARRSRRIAARDIELFTELTGDRNPLHYDEKPAGKSRFGGVIVQGDVTLGLLNAVVAEDLFEARTDKPLTRLRTTIVNQEGIVVLDGTALVWTEML